MDKEETSKEASEGKTRESLISLSYSTKEKDLAAGISSENSNGTKMAEGVYDDKEEQCRCQLISISYQLSPEINALPVLPGDVKG